MEPVPDECLLTEQLQLHPIAAQVFVPLAILRLRDDVSREEALVDIVLRGPGGEQQRQLRLRWPGVIVPAQPLGRQENTITEWAALAVACVVLPRYAGVRIRSVAVPGNSIDY